MQRISVRTQSADGKAVVRELLPEFLQGRLVFQQGQLAVGISGEIARPEFESRDAEAFQLLHNVVDGELRKQRGKNANSHKVQNNRK